MKRILIAFVLLLACCAVVMAADTLEDVAASPTIIPTPIATSEEVGIDVTAPITPITVELKVYGENTDPWVLSIDNNPNQYYAGTITVELKGGAVNKNTIWQVLAWDVGTGGTEPVYSKLWSGTLTKGLTNDFKIRDISGKFVTIGTPTEKSLIAQGKGPGLVPVDIHVRQTIDPADTPAEDYKINLKLQAIAV